jgi:hypothetical protein
MAISKILCGAHIVMRLDMAPIFNLHLSNAALENALCSARPATA